ncbi:TPA: zinc ABC transporter substrate-binding protein, partial [Streptococcus suis]|nr:zinc ABC transporter substrate-binding protein [Streptococcus suis]
MFKKIVGTCLLAVFGFVLAACSAQKEASQVQPGMKIVTSFYPIYSLVKEVSGNKNDVRMIGSRQGIHSYEPSAADIKAIYDADVFIYHSRILESWAGRL